MVERGEQSQGAHGPDKIAGRKDHVPARIAAHHLRQHFLIAFVGSVMNPQAGLALELRDGFRRNIIRPVVDIQPRTANAGSCDGRSQQKRPALHARRSLSEIRTRAPSSTTMVVETALSTGLTPRRAIA